MAEEPARLDSIQRLRGVAAVLVVFAHTVDLVEARSSSLGRSFIASSGHVENFGAIGVDLFFIISGFVMALSSEKLLGPRDSIRFLRLRWIRIAPPYLIVTAALVLFGLLARKADPTVASISNAVVFVPVLDLDRYVPPALTVGWTLSFEFTFYLLVAALIVLARRHRLRWMIGVLLTAALVGTIWPPSVFILGWVTNPIGLEFALGIGAFLLWRSGALHRRRPAWIALGIAGGLALVSELLVGFGAVSEEQFVVDGRLSLHRVVLWGLPVFAILLAVVPTRISPRRLPSRVLRVLGDSSYSIYLVHIPVLMGLNLLLKTVPVAPPADLVLVIGVVLATLAGIQYFQWVERPLTRALRARLTAGARPRPLSGPEQSLAPDG